MENCQNCSDLENRIKELEKENQALSNDTSNLLKVIDEGVYSIKQALEEMRSVL